MKLFQCPKCGNDSTKEDRTYVVVCPCGEIMKLIKNTPDKPPASPEIIFRGDGWPSKDIRKENKNE